MQNQKLSDIMGNALYEDLQLIARLAQDLSNVAHRLGVHVTIEPKRHPMRPGYENKISVNAMRHRWSAVEAQKDQEEAERTRNMDELRKHANTPKVKK